MDKLVILKFGDGDWEQGFSVTLQIALEGTRPSVELSGQLPPAPDIPLRYSNWREAFLNIFKFQRGLQKPASQVTNSSHVITECSECAQVLADTLKTWLNSEPFRPIKERMLSKLDSNETIRVIIQTDNLELRRLPWHLWDFFDSQSYPKAEIAVSTPEYDQHQKTTITKEKVRVLAILGDDEGINLEADREFLSRLPETEIVFLVKPQREDINDLLWEQDWDILFFAGHSQTKEKTGEININPDEKLKISDLKNGLRKAIQRGLKLAIFNSCDGLGLANELEDLQIGQIIVMRERVPDEVAQDFLKYFLSAFAEGQSLYLAVRTARERLQDGGIEKRFPGATWLPVICQHPAELPPTWESLGGVCARIEQPISECPYRGLSAFREEHSSFFFGREVFKNSLVKAVKKQPLVGVIGPSGSGKSSVVFAGMIPQLRAEGNWLIGSFRPKSLPFNELAAVLVRFLEPHLGEVEQAIKAEELAKAMREKRVSLASVVSRIVEKNPGKRFLLINDQFEELYTLSQDEEQQRFLDELLSAVEAFAEKLPLDFTLVFTLRADFYGSVLSYRRFRDVVDRFTPQLLGPMADEELQAAIEKPAEYYGVKLESGLTQRILEDIAQEPGNLPLLEFALTQLWKEQRYRKLTHSAYSEIEGVQKALAKHAKAVYEGLSEDEPKQAQQIFLQLVRPGEGTEDTRRLATRTEVGEGNWGLVRKLADESARLVVTGRNEAMDEETVEIVHEALIREWGSLREWMNKERTFRIWQEQLRASMRQWQATGQDQGALLHGVVLLNAKKELENHSEKLNENERNFIQLSWDFQEREKEERDRNRRRIILGLTGGLVTVSLFAVGAVWQWQRAERQSLINEVDSLSNLALNQFQSGEGGINALMSAMEAGQKLKQLVREGEPLANYPTISPFSALETITQNIREKNKFQSDTDGINKAIFTPDGKYIVSLVIDDNKAIILNLDGQKVTELEHPDSEEIYDFAISPNGKYIATISNISSSLAGVDRKLSIWDISGKELLHTPLFDLFNSVKFSLDNQYIAVTSNRHNEVIFFNLAGKQVKKIVTDGGGTIWSLAFTPNGEEIIIGNAVGLVQFWNLQTLQKTRELRTNTNQVVKIDISPDGKKLLTLGVDFTPQKTPMAGTRLWSLSDGKVTDFGLLPIYSNSNIPFSDVGFSPDGKQFAMVGIEFGGVKLYDALSGTIIDQLTINAASGYNFSYSPDSKIIAISGINGINFLSNIQSNSAKLMTQQKFIELPVSYEVENNNVKSSSLIHFQYSADGKKLIIIDKLNNFLDIWNLEKQEKRRINLSTSLVKYTQFTKEINNFASITPNGKSIIIVTNDSIQKLDLEGNLIDKIKADLSSEGQILRNDIALGLYRYPGRDTSYSSNSDGNQIATIGDIYDIQNNEFPYPARLWNFSTKQVKPLKNNSAHPTVGQVLVSPNGKYILTISSGIGKLWDTEGNLLNPLDINAKSSLKEKEISFVAILLDDKVEKNFFNESGVEILEVWHNSTAMKAGLKSGDVILEIDGRKVDEFKEIWQFQSLLKGEPSTPVKLKVKNRNAGNILEKTVLREKFILDLSNWQLFIGNNAKFSPDSQYLASWDQGTQDLSLRNIQTKKLTEINHKAIIVNVFFSPDSKFIVTTGADYTVKIWDFSGKLVNQIKLQQIPNGLAFSPNSKQIAILGHLNELSVWSIEGKQIAKYTVPEEGQGQIVFSPDGKYIATGGRKVFIWRLEKDLNGLLAAGCDWLKEYFITHPEEKQKLKVCDVNTNSKL